MIDSIPWHLKKLDIYIELSDRRNATSQGLVLFIYCHVNVLLGNGFPFNVNGSESKLKNNCCTCKLKEIHILRSRRK